MRNFLSFRAARALCYVIGAAAVIVSVAACSPITKGSVVNAPELTAAAQNQGAQATNKDFVVAWLLYGTPTATPTLDAVDMLTATAAGAMKPVAAASVPTSTQAAPAAAANSGSASTGNDAPPKAPDGIKGDANAGALTFQGVGTCTSCHDTSANITIVGPSMVGVAARAATRKPGYTADEYLRESIEKPQVFVVEGFQPVMPQNFSQALSAQQIEDIIAYLETLK